MVTNENNNKEFVLDQNTSLEPAANVHGLLAVKKDGSGGAVGLEEIANEAGKKIGEAVKVTGTELPKLGEANKIATIYGGADGKIMSYNGSPLPAIAKNKVALFFWDGVLENWEKLDEVDLGNPIDKNFDTSSSNPVANSIVAKRTSLLQKLESESIKSGTIKVIGYESIFDALKPYHKGVGILKDNNVYEGTSSVTAHVFQGIPTTAMNSITLNLICSLGSVSGEQALRRLVLGKKTIDGSWVAIETFIESQTDERKDVLINPALYSEFSFSIFPRDLDGFYSISSDNLGMDKDYLYNKIKDLEDFKEDSTVAIDKLEKKGSLLDSFEDDAIIKYVQKSGYINILSYLLPYHKGVGFLKDNNVYESINSGTSHIFQNVPTAGLTFISLNLINSLSGISGTAGLRRILLGKKKADGSWVTLETFVESQIDTRKNMSVDPNVYSHFSFSIFERDSSAIYDISGNNLGLNNEYLHDKIESLEGFKSNTEWKVDDLVKKSNLLGKFYEESIIKEKKIDGYVALLSNFQQYHMGTGFLRDNNIFLAGGGSSHIFQNIPTTGVKSITIDLINSLSGLVGDEGLRRILLGKKKTDGSWVTIETYVQSSVDVRKTMSVDPTIYSHFSFSIFERDSTASYQIKGDNLGMDNDYLYNKVSGGDDFSGSTRELALGKIGFGYLYFEGALPTDASESRTPTKLKWNLYDENHKWLVSGICELSIQGQGSATYPKKGLTFDVMNEAGKSLKLKFGDMVSADSFHLKAFQTDPLHCKETASLAIWSDMIKTLDYPLCKFNNMPVIETANPVANEFFIADAKYYTNGFPIALYNNGDFVGLYTFRQKKTRENYALNNANLNHIFLDSAVYGAYLDAPFNPAQWEIKSPKMTGYTDMGAIPSAYSSTVGASINRLFNFTNNVASMKANAGDYIVVKHWLLYCVLFELIGYWDSNGNNVNLFTWNNNQYSIFPYDMDQILGISINDQHITQSGWVMGGTFFSNFKNVFKPEISAEYTRLRKSGFIQVNKLIQYYINHAKQIPRSVYDADFKKWGIFRVPAMPHIEHIYAYLDSRIKWLDAQWYVA